MEKAATMAAAEARGERGQGGKHPQEHLLRVGWRNFFLVVVLCQFLVLAGNRFWFYILMYLEYNTVVVSC